MYSLLANKSNYSAAKRKEKDVLFLVVHYTANNGDTARNNLRYYNSYVVGASAHFFIDENEVCCSVPWYYPAWHCGTKGAYKHPKCRNNNSIGIELCSRKDEKGEYYFKNEVVERAAEFVALQMKIYNIPIDNVIRHYDVTGKLCPRPFVSENEWEKFKKKVLDYLNKKGDAEMVYYETLESIPAGEQRNVVQELVEKGVIKGNGAGLHLSADMVRMFVFMRRAGVI